MKAKVDLRRGCMEVKPLRLRVFFPSVEAVVTLRAWGANFLPARGRRPPAQALAICLRSPGSARPGRLQDGRCRAPRPGAEPPPGLRRGSGSRRLQRNREAGGVRCAALPGSGDSASARAAPAPPSSPGATCSSPECTACGCCAAFSKAAAAMSTRAHWESLENRFSKFPS